MSSSSPRPGQTTLAGWLIIGGSVVLVLTAWQRISTLHTLEVQEELQRVLSEPGLDGLGMSVSTLSEVIRVLCMVAAGAATASAILGFHALRRSTSARLALTLLAPLIAVGGFATAGFFAPMVVAGVVMLWLRPTRDWFAGRPWTPQRPERGGSTPTREERPDPFAPPAPEAPRADPRSPAAPPPYEGVYGAPVPEQPLTGRPAHPPHPPAAGVQPIRPGRLIAACVITWVSSLTVAGAMGLAALLLLADPSLMDQAIADAEGQGVDLQGLGRDELTAATVVISAVFVVWSLAAAGLAILAYRRVEWARIVLIISAAVSGLLMLVMALMAPFLVVLVAAAAVTCALLLRPEVAAYFRR
ncbi:putative integral membrane protein [Nocardioides thalensis]|uniref:Putative integral membrane protein n=1 Tax=Nocardioides thalensis TaxID=1914755 RepID=A0A853C5G7_9ACTN|nr:hypothetical protein [Nocardioides thalensis]NYJ03035.1 putative integral membrane protein [Nocardioides thalensis]